MAGEVVLESRDLTKVFKDFWRRDKVRAVDNVNLKVTEGQVYGLLGPNGSGKSTFVKLALGLLHPTSGYVAVFGRNPGNNANKGRIGYLPEDSYLYRYQDAESALDFYGKLHGLSGLERRKRTEALIDMVGLRAARKRPIREYSKGMARRIGLAQALIGDPDVLFLDEPTSGLDPIGTGEMKDLIGDLRKRGKTILMCSHLLADVENICDHIAVLYGGKLCTEGAVGDLLTRKDTVQITAPALGEEALRQIARVIENEVGASPEISNPSERLEAFFLKVVAAAREKRLPTGGAEAGTGTPAFLGEQGAARKSEDDAGDEKKKAELEAKRRHVLDELLKPR